MPERLTDPRYWKQTTQEIEGAFAAPPKPPGTPGAFIENVQRPTDRLATQIGEQISPTLGAFGMGQLAGDTALRFSEGDYTGAAMNAPMLAMALAPGVKMKKYPMAPRSEWWSDANFEATGGKLGHMSPDDYLARVRPLEIDDVSRENIDLLKEHMESGRTLDPLAIWKNGKEDGRHRAQAAKELGIDEVPVLEWDK
jgi:hypothetical protein